MPSRFSDDAEYRFLAAPGASMDVRLGTDSVGKLEIQLFGNRAGILSLANVLFWLFANAWRREFLSLSELHFVRVEGALSVYLRLTADEPTGCDGFVSRTDRGEQFEWEITEDDLRRVALTVHRLACKPVHEYDRLRVADQSAVGVHVRMTDAGDWIEKLNAEPGG